VKYLVYDTIFIEEMGKPIVTLAFQYFTNDALSAASSKGMPGVRVIPESIISKCSVMEEIGIGVTVSKHSQDGLFALRK
jgi:hypothetical protein